MTIAEFLTLAEHRAAEGQPAAHPADRGLSLCPGLLLFAAALLTIALFLPLWGVQLVSAQYPDGVRMVVYADHLAGNIDAVNALNAMIGRMPVHDMFLPELRILPVLFASAAVLAVGAAFVRRVWATTVALGAVLGIGVYGLLSVRERLYAFGHDLDAATSWAAAPFTPPSIGMSQVAGVVSHSAFGWGTYLPVTAMLLLALSVWIDVRARRNAG
jgi:copper chaperone NosL